MKYFKDITEWLNHYSPLSQWGLLVLAVFGYFYSVKPAFDKALLQEQISALELQLEEKEEQLNSFEPRIRKKEAQISKLLDNMQELQSEAEQLYFAVRNSLFYQLLSQIRKECAVNEIHNNTARELWVCTKNITKLWGKNPLLREKDRQIVDEIIGKLDASPIIKTIQDAILQEQKSYEQQAKEVERNTRSEEESYEEEQSTRSYRLNRKKRALIDRDYQQKMAIIRIPLQLKRSDFELQRRQKIIEKELMDQFVDDVEMMYLNRIAQPVYRP